LLNKIKITKKNKLIIKETQFNEKHRKFVINSFMIHCISIFSGLLGIMFTVLEYKAIICIIFDSISVVSAIFIVITERRNKKKLEKKININFAPTADSRDLVNITNKILSKDS